MPVSNHAPEFLELFRRANLRPVTIHLESLKRAIYFRARLYKVRRAMRIEQHYLSQIAEGVSISVRELPDGSAELIAGPADNAFAATLRQAGIRVETPELTTEDVIKDTFKPTTKEET